jgi:hypothetical protein
MNREHFQMQLVRLSGRWPRAHPPEFITLLWREVKDLPEEWFTRTVDELIGSCRMAPLMPEFREFISVELEKQWSRQKQEPQKQWNPNPSCEFCRDNGVYVCKRDEHEGLWAFRCHCSKGMNDPRKAIPQFKADHAKEFTFYEVRRHA